jgi:acetylornithine deacetylase/succinyl-diaminopimelate desuccinylase-like protein
MTEPIAVSTPRPADVLSELIRFDTTNPPGNEGPCLQYVDTLFAARGVRGTVLSRDGRPNLVVRVKGRGEAPPLLMQGHVDVVTTVGQDWSRAPFGGEQVDGWVWGRGALDMKGGVAMMITALLRCLDEGRPPAGDVILVCLADEEAGGVHGAKFLVEEHAALFEGVRHGLGEGGGVSQQIAGRTFFPVMVAEKRACRLRLTVRGPGGHASRRHQGGTMSKLAALLAALDRARMPVRVTEVADRFVRGIAEGVEPAYGERLLGLLDPSRTDALLDEMGPQGATFDPILHNTVNATVVRAGGKINVIPSEAVVDADGRVLPGVVADEFVAEVRAVVGPEPEIEVTNQGPMTAPAEFGDMYRLLCDVLAELRPGARPVPVMLSGATDQRHFARLGIVGYGYLPLLMEGGTEWQTVHAADERVPAAALDFGADALYRVVQRYRG